MVFKVVQFVFQLMFKYRIRSRMLMSWVKSWIRRRCNGVRHRGWSWWMMMNREPGMGWRCNGWINGLSWCERSNILNQDVRDRASSTDRDISGLTQRQAMGECTKVLAVDGDSVLSMFSGDCDFKRLMGLNRVPPITLLSSGDLVQQMISHDCVFLRSNVDLKHRVISWLQGSATLNVYRAPNFRQIFFVISHCNYRR